MRLQGIPLLFGLLLAFTVLAATLSLTLPYGVEDFPSIHYACSLNGLAPPDCLRSAQWVGVLSLTAFAVVLALGLWRQWFSGGAMVLAPLAPVPTALFLVGTLGLLALHAGLQVGGSAFVSRLNESESFGLFISLENLLLPLLLQVFVSAPKDGALRLPLLAALLMGMALSPYRAMLMALFGFGLFLPLLLDGWRFWRGNDRAESWKSLGREVALVLLVGAALLQAGLQDTKFRSPTLLAQSLELAGLPEQEALSSSVLKGIARRQTEAAASLGGPAAAKSPALAIPHEAEEMLMPAADLKRRLIQRITFPLFQAAIVGQLADRGENLPSPGGQVLRKLRLSSEPNLEEFLFRRIYGGQGHGETTSLTYGEARAFVPGPPLVWMILVPLGLLLACRMAAKRGLEGGSLFGLALWRSSFSGLLPIFPALLLQTLGLWLLSRLRLERLVVAARLLLILALLASLLVDSWGLASALAGRQDILLARYELAAGCWLESPSLVPGKMASLADEKGLAMESVVVAHHRTALAIAFPYGRKAEAMLEPGRGVIANLSRCQDKPEGGVPAEAVTLLDSHLVERDVGLLQGLIVLVLAAGLWKVWRWRRL